MLGCVVGHPPLAGGIRSEQDSPHSGPPSSVSGDLGEQQVRADLDPPDLAAIVGFDPRCPGISLQVKPIGTVIGVEEMDPVRADPQFPAAA